MTNFSYEETNTGITWIDGREIYQRSFRWNNPGVFNTGSAFSISILEKDIRIVDFIILLESNRGSELVYNATNIMQDPSNKSVTIVTYLYDNSIKPNTGIVTIWYVDK